MQNINFATQSRCAFNIMLQLNCTQVSTLEMQESMIMNTIRKDNEGYHSSAYKSSRYVTDAVGNHSLVTHEMH